VILIVAPYLLKLLSIAGTAAMFIVGGSILTHGIPPVHEALEHWAHALASLTSAGWLLSIVAAIALDAAFGILVGSVVLAIALAIKKMMFQPPAAAPEKSAAE
jgi:predicted DNA repair protein MutK